MSNITWSWVTTEVFTALYAQCKFHKITTQVIYMVNNIYQTNLRNNPAQNVVEMPFLEHETSIELILMAI